MKEEKLFNLLIKQDELEKRLSRNNQYETNVKEEDQFNARQMFNKNLSELTESEKLAVMSRGAKEFSAKMEKIRAELDFVREEIRILNEGETEASITELRYPADLGKVPYKMNYCKFTFFEHRPTQKNFSDFKEEHIVYPVLFLPISPRLLYNTISINYGQEELDQLGNVLYNNTREYGVTTDGIRKALQHTFSEFGDNAQDMAEGYLMHQLLRTDIASVRSTYHGYGLAYNNNMTARYQGKIPQYRSFIPSWTFVPKNEGDAKTLLDVVRIFQKNVLPRTLNSTKTDQSIKYSNHFKYPRKVKLELFVGGQPFKKFQYLPMFCMQVEVSHNDASSSQNPETIPLHKTPEGQFYNTETTINLIFEETEVFTRSKVPDTLGNMGLVPLDLYIQKQGEMTQGIIDAMMEIPMQQFKDFMQE